MPNNNVNTGTSTHNSTDKEHNILHAVNGYQDALDHQRELIKTGTDFNEQNGKVANTIAINIKNNLTLPSISSPIYPLI
jgi:hypothetical protein